jgi:16S rRNA (guanine1516-N2)-methyltransferase
MDKRDPFAGLFIDASCTDNVAEYVKALAEQYATPVIDVIPDDGLFLIADEQGLGLCDSTLPKQSPVRAEFTSAEMRYRLKASGAKSELIMRAIGNKNALWQVIDATPGLGRDAMVMATFGCKVTMLERSPVVAMLLADGLRQLGELQPELRNNLHLEQGDSIKLLSTSQLADRGLPTPDAVYLDPMFPHRKKSALVKKEMQLFQRLLGHDPDADSLILSAMSVASKRVVVKRPNSAQPLNMQKPDVQIKSKKHRFDVYLTR